MDDKIKTMLWGNGQKQTGLGLRTIKSAVAVMLCFLIYELYKLAFGAAYAPTPFYACIAAILCMQDSVHKTLSMGIARVVGTIIGGMVGLCSALVAGYIPSWSFILLVGVCIIICINICNMLGNQSACAISCVVFLAVVARIDSDHAMPLYLFAIYRVVETIAGIIIAATVNKFLANPFKKGKNMGGESANPSDETEMI